MKRVRRTTVAALLVIAFGAMGCSMLAEVRLEGEWESDPTPKRTLVLKGDGTYQQRFSGKTLGFVSEMLGPETGTWSVEGASVVLVRRETSGEETLRKLPMASLTSDSVMLAGERWTRIKR